MKRQLIGLCTVLVLSGCAAGATGASSQYYASQENYSGPAAYAMDGMDYLEEPVEVETETVLTGEKLVYTGNLTVQTLSYETSVQNLRQYIVSKNGIIEYEYEYDNDNSWYYSSSSNRTGTRHLNLTVRIPTESFQSFLEDMDGVGKVVSRNTSVENITRRYNDVSVQIEALEIQQNRLLEMMNKAETIEEMVLVEERLTEVQTQLNRMRTERESMDTDIQYSTVTITVDEVMEYSMTNESFLHRIGNAFVYGISGFFDTLGDLLVEITYGWLYIVLLVIIVVIAKKTHFLQKLTGRFRKQSRD